MGREDGTKPCPESLRSGRDARSTTEGADKPFALIVSLKGRGDSTKTCVFAKRTHLQTLHFMQNCHSGSEFGFAEVFLQMGSFFRKVSISGLVVGWLGCGENDIGAFATGVRRVASRPTRLCAASAALGLLHLAALLRIEL